MPAPTSEVIYNSLYNFVLNVPDPNDSTIKRFTKKEFQKDSEGNIVKDDDGNPILSDTGDLTDDMKELLQAIADGINDFWTQWQSAQTVAVTVNNVTLVQPGVGASGPGTGTGTLP